jgi:hypothetical protein
MCHIYSIYEGFKGGIMNRYLKYCAIGCVGMVLSFSLVSNSWAQAGGHASVGLGHGEEGYLHLQEMVKHLEFSLKMPDASEELKTHVAVSLKHAKEALKHYDEALKHASESLGRPRTPMMSGGEGSGGEAPKREEGSNHQHEEGSN